MKLTWQAMDKVLVNPKGRFRLTPDEMHVARAFRAFCRTALGIDIHVGQMAFAGAVLRRHPANWEMSAYLTLLLASGNRAGKTALLAMLIIYCCLSKVNRPRPLNEEQAERWLRMEYHWYHFGISQEVADLVFNDMVRILNGTHEGQEGRGCPMAEGRQIAVWEQKEYGDYRWVRFSPDLGGAQVHFRTTGEKALSSLGKDMHGISFDEAGLERNLDFLMKEVFNLRRLGTGGQLILVSTPSEDLGFAFAENWEQGNPANPRRLTSWCAMRMSSRDNVGYGLSADMFERLVADMDERSIQQNIEGIFLQAKAAYFHGGNVDRCFIEDLPERIPAVKGGIYLQGIDPAKTQDSAWSIVLKLVPNAEDPTRPTLVGVKAAQARGQKSTETLVGLAVDGFNSYDNRRVGSTCYTATDATGFGGKMFREALSTEVPNVTNVEFGGTVQKKRKLLGDLRTLIDEGRLLLPSEGIWKEVRRQLLGYRLEDRGIVQDAVMALVCAVTLVRRTNDGSSMFGSFDPHGMYTEDHERMEALNWLRPVKR